MSRVVARDEAVIGSPAPDVQVWSGHRVSLDDPGVADRFVWQSRAASPRPALATGWHEPTGYSGSRNRTTSAAMVALVAMWAIIAMRKPPVITRMMPSIRP